MFSGKHAPEPPSKRLATPRDASRFAACISPSPPKSWPSLTNPAYAHGLLYTKKFILKNTLVESTLRQTVDCVYRQYRTYVMWLYTRVYLRGGGGVQNPTEIFRFFLKSEGKEIERKKGCWGGGWVTSSHIFGG